VTETEKKLMAEFHALGRTRYEALLAERTATLEQEINTLPLYLELLCYCIKDACLRDSLVRLGRTSNLLDKAPASMKVFLFEMRDIDLQNVFNELERSEYDGILIYEN